MAKKTKNDEIIFAEQIVQKPMEDVMHDSMIPYSEHVILERALPRVEDGLKPVQRRILYTMYELGNTNDKPHRKCARIVGDCLGKYHPHGDSSVYDALARMAQPFVMRELLVDGHGNFGSVDGDSPAAMRYTEARMTLQAQELLRDIEKDTVSFHLNFDDSLQEPDVLPARFPNLLVNGASGIAVGLATNIPTHNLGECIDGAVALMEKPDMTPEEMEHYIPAPDFPTGGIICRDEELHTSLATGRGKVQVRAKVHIEDASSGKKLIVITEIPYQVNKAAMLEKILRVSEEKKGLFGDITDIRDESDRTGMRAVIELKKDANVDRTLNALYRYSDLQSTFGVNMVVIANGKPQQMGIVSLLNCFIAHQKDVVTRRTRFELHQAEARAHILEGLIIAVDNLDEVIRLIRSSKNPKEARDKLMSGFSLSELQAQAILDMRLQRLTNLEVLSLRKEYEDLLKLIKKLRGILASEKKLIDVIRTELLAIKEKFPSPRRTAIADSFELYEAEEEEVPAENVCVILNNDGFLKRFSEKQKEKLPDIADTIRFARMTQTDKKLGFITDAGMCYQADVMQVPDCRIKDRGLPVGGVLAGIGDKEKILYVFEVSNDLPGFLLVTGSGSGKRLSGSELSVRSRSFRIISLKEADKLASALPIKDAAEVLLVADDGSAIDIATEDIPEQGRQAAGVRLITVSKESQVIGCVIKDTKLPVILASDSGHIKKCPVTEFEKQARGGKGSRAFPLLKNGANGSRVVAVLSVKNGTEVTAILSDGSLQKLTTDIIRAENKSGRGQPLIVMTPGNTLSGLRTQPDLKEEKS